MGVQTQRRPGEVVFAGMMLAISILLFWQAYRISGFSSKSSPGAFPLAATATMIAASLASLLKTLRLPATSTGFEAVRRMVLPNTVLAFAALIAGYGLFIENLGFLLSSLAFLFLGMLVLHRRGPARALLYSVISIILVYVVFRLVFQVVLPEGILPERRFLAIIGDLLAGLRR
jgi:hypothetical protein